MSLNKKIDKCKNSYENINYKFNIRKTRNLE